LYFSIQSSWVRSSFLEEVLDDCATSSSTSLEDFSIPVIYSINSLAWKQGCAYTSPNDAKILLHLLLIRLDVIKVPKALKNTREPEGKILD
jgi:hypothetical protein